MKILALVLMMAAVGCGSEGAEDALEQEPCPPLPPSWCESSEGACGGTLRFECVYDPWENSRTTPDGSNCLWARFVEDCADRGMLCQDRTWSLCYAPEE